MSYKYGELTGGNSFWTRVVLYAGLGWSRNLKGETLAKVAFGGPVVERVLGITLEQALEQWVRQEMAKHIFQDLEVSIKQVSFQLKRRTENIPLLSTFKPIVIDKDSKWLNIIIHPSVVLILGKRGSGKSGLGYRLLELFRYRLTPYVLGIPAQAQKLLPNFIGVAQELDDIPQGSIVLVDEAYLAYHSRESLKLQSREMSRIVNLSRQRDQTLIFVTQEARQIDKNIASQANVVVFKELGMLQLKFDRPELNNIAMQAKQAFSTISGDKRRWAYVYSPDADFVGLMENSLPTFWNQKLSCAFGIGEPLSGKRVAKKMPKEDKMIKAKELRKSGLSYRKIGSMLGINEGTVYNYVNDYPYKGKSS